LTARIWDIRPYASSQRCVKVLTGHQHNFEKVFLGKTTTKSTKLIQNLLKCAWSSDSHRVSCGTLKLAFNKISFIPGSSDRFVYVWDTGSRNIAYKLPGHQGSVNAVDFHPTEPIGEQNFTRSSTILNFSPFGWKRQTNVPGRVGPLITSMGSVY
jgi:Prp8 binding protein